MFIWAMFGALGADSLICLKQIDEMDSKIGFEMSVIVVEVILGQCASFVILTATVSEDG